MFEPVNPLEKSLMNAATNPADRPQFYRDLLESEIYLINHNRDQLHIQNASTPTGNSIKHPILRAGWKDLVADLFLPRAVGAVHSL